MTVQELIDKLSTFPRDVQVVYSFCSDYAWLEAEEISILRAEDKKIIVRNGKCCHAYPNEVWPTGEKPKFITAVHFPGN